MNPQDPQPVDDNNTNMSGLSDGLEEFLDTWCDPTVDPQNVALMLHSPQGAQYKSWVPEQMRAAYQEGILGPEFLSLACNRQFSSQQEVDGWLQSMWPLWFDEPFFSSTVPGQDTGPAPTPTQGGDLTIEH